ncbi:MAG: hypothetical protein IKJ99_02170 [Oscillospiraceae bacterium]|nr:hypothetical protein [Oscillospiraceae bacterium]
MENQDKDILQEQEEELEQQLQQETPKYIPRPAWQVWGARIALVLFIALILMYMINIARGNL